jgi:leucine-rich repeat-containing protein 49
MQGHMSDLIPQGKSLSIAVKKVPVSGPGKSELAKPASSESDERYQYLMKRGIIRRVEKDEKIIFAELPGLAGVLVVYRSPAERTTNPERLNLDRRDLTSMPLLEGEEKLRLLNYQHNQITKIENLISLPNLIFLDLYNNQIKEINGLHTVPGLRVLMLGKNLIEKIKNLTALTKLDVLDLHSNKISKIENLGNLSELRVLNLANNLIQVMENLESLRALTEINLRRNSIEVIRGVSPLLKLQRLFLSNNKLDRIESIEVLANCSALTELALDSNPIQNILNYSASVLAICKNLTSFDMRKVTQEMKESSVKTPKLTQDSALPSENLITSISAEWQNEVERLKMRGLNSFRRRKETPNESLVQSGHAEIEGETNLFIYGNAVEVITKPEFQESVTFLHFQFVRFDIITQNSSLQKLRKFVNLKKMTLIENNLHSYIQLSKIESIPSLISLNIEKNDVIFTNVFRSFVVYRFPHLTEICDEKVTDEDRTRAKQQFQNFDRILCNPSILVRDKQKAGGEEDKENQKNLRIVSKKNASFAEGFVKKIIEHAVLNERKNQALDEFWNGFIVDICRSTARELADQRVVKEESLYSFK